MVNPTWLFFLFRTLILLRNFSSFLDLRWQKCFCSEQMKHLHLLTVLLWHRAIAGGGGGGDGMGAGLPALSRLGGEDTWRVLMNRMEMPTVALFTWSETPRCGWKPAEHRLQSTKDVRETIHSGEQQTGVSPGFGIWGVDQSFSEGWVISLSLCLPRAWNENATWKMQSATAMWLLHHGPSPSLFLSTGNAPVYWHLITCKCPFPSLGSETQNAFNSPSKQLLRLVPLHHPQAASRLCNLGYIFPRLKKNTYYVGEGGTKIKHSHL